MAHVLIADDDPDIRVLLSTVLAEDGHQVDIAADGETAWRRLRTSTGKMVMVLDVAMPELSGIEVLERVLNDRDLAGRLGCVLITGLPLAGPHSLPRDLLAHLPIPIVTLSKPLDLQALKRAMSQVGCHVDGA